MVTSHSKVNTQGILNNTSNEYNLCNNNRKTRINNHLNLLIDFIQMAVMSGFLYTQTHTHDGFSNYAKPFAYMLYYTGYHFMHFKSTHKADTLRGQPIFEWHTVHQTFFKAMCTCVFLALMPAVHHHHLYLKIKPLNICQSAFNHVLKNTKIKRMNLFLWKRIQTFWGVGTCAKLPVKPRAIRFGVTMSIAFLVHHMHTSPLSVSHPTPLMKVYCTLQIHFWWFQQRFTAPRAKKQSYIEINHPHKGRQCPRLKQLLEQISNQDPFHAENQIN